ncbi:MAG: (Fe-S)-binding protein [Alphaproteobacteria bacterium]
MPPVNPKIALFVTCLVDMFRPSAAFAAVGLLEAAGCVVAVPQTQTCCGQPSYNSGDRSGAMLLAAQTIRTLMAYDYVVVPSGSCAAMIKRHYPELLSADVALAAQARALAAKTYELTRFLHDVMQFRPASAASENTTYLDSCSGLRELGVQAQPRALAPSGFIENGDAETCCGFGGTFCVKYTGVSTAIADKKLNKLAATGATTVTGGDLGCLMHLAGRAARRGLPLRFRHVAEVLAGDTHTPAIGEAGK